MQEATPPAPGRSNETTAAHDAVPPRVGLAKSMPSWAILLAASLVCQAVNHWVHHASFSVVRFSDRIVDPNLLRGINFAPINAIYASVILLSIIGFLAAIRVLLGIFRDDAGRAGYAHITIETQVIGTLSAFTILLLCLSVLGSRSQRLAEIRRSIVPGNCPDAAGGCCQSCSGQGQTHANGNTVSSARLQRARQHSAVLHYPAFCVRRVFR